MKQKMIKKIVAASVSATLAFAPILGNACTAVNVVAKDGSVVAGRTMEWAFDMQWQVLSLPAGTQYQMTAPAGLKLAALPMKTKYAVVGVGPGIIPGNVLLEGQNSAGMGFSGNFLPGFQFQGERRRNPNGGLSHS